MPIELRTGDAGFRPPARRATRFAALALVAALGALAIEGPATAQPAPPAKVPAAAPAGAYKIDPAHSSIIARVSHQGFSSSTLRFGVTSGTLNWDPANPANIKLDVTVSAMPHYAPIEYRAGNEPNSANWLNVAAFPTARFVSTRVTPEGQTRARVDGELTLRGVTKPATMSVELIGAGPAGDTPRVGFGGTMKFKRSDFGITALLGPVGDEVELQLDAEFNRG
jgi:polyisoprenoid-binding protein YceI